MNITNFRYKVLLIIFLLKTIIKIESLVFAKELGYKLNTGS